jgi:Tetratricopeptide repeat
VLHHQLAGIHAKLGDLERARQSYYEAIRLHDAVGDRLRAGQSREDLANALVHRSGSRREALSLVEAAVRDYESLGSPGAGAAAAARRLAAEIRGGPPTRSS